MQSTNQRRLLPPGNPGTTCPLRLFQTFLPSLVLSPPSPALGRTRRTSFSIFFPLNLSFFPLFSFLFSFCASYFFFLQVMLWVSGIPAAQRVGKLWKVGIFPSQKADGSCPVSRWSWGPERRVWPCPGCCHRAVPAPSGWVAALGAGDVPRCPAEEGSGLAAPLVLCSVPMRSEHPFARRVTTVPGSSRGIGGSGGNSSCRIQKFLPLGVLGLGPAGRMELKVTAKGGLGDFGTGVLPPVLANPGLELGENSLS